MNGGDIPRVVVTLALEGRVEIAREGATDLEVAAKLDALLTADDDRRALVLAALRIAQPPAIELDDHGLLARLAAELAPPVENGMSRLSWIVATDLV